MNVTDLSNYTPIYGRGAEFRRELVEFVRYFTTHKNSAVAAAELFAADVAKIEAALSAVAPEPTPED